MTTGIECTFTTILSAAPDELRTSAAGKPWLCFNAGVGEGDAVLRARCCLFR